MNLVNFGDFLWSLELPTFFMLSLSCLQPGSAYIFKKLKQCNILELLFIQYSSLFVFLTSTVQLCWSDSRLQALMKFVQLSSSNLEKKTTKLWCWKSTFNFLTFSFHI